MDVPVCWVIVADHPSSSLVQEVPAPVLDGVVNALALSSDKDAEHVEALGLLRGQTPQDVWDAPVRGPLSGVAAHVERCCDAEHGYRVGTGVCKTLSGFPLVGSGPHRVAAMDRASLQQV